MIKHEVDGVSWLTFELLADLPHIDFRVYQRHGGFSTTPVTGLNFRTSADIPPSEMRANFQILEKHFPYAPIVKANQVHGIEIQYVNQQNKNDVFSCDALSTLENNIALVIRHADCQAACFYDPIEHALLTVHCGWRGNVQNIYARCIDYMRTKYHSKPENLLVCISPSLGPVRSEFINYKTELPKSFAPFQYKPLYFDLWAISEWQLESAGILPQHHQLAKICTWSNPCDYYSYRRSPIVGNNASIAVLRKL